MRRPDRIVAGTGFPRAIPRRANASGLKRDKPPGTVRPKSGGRWVPNVRIPTTGVLSAHGKGREGVVVRAPEGYLLPPRRPAGRTAARGNRGERFPQAKRDDNARGRREQTIS